MSYKLILKQYVPDMDTIYKQLALLQKDTK